MSPEKLHDLQITKLETLLKYTYEYVPYYRKLFIKMGFNPTNLLKNFSNIPFLTKNLISSNINDICSSEYKRFSGLFRTALAVRLVKN